MNKWITVDNDDNDDDTDRQQTINHIEDNINFLIESIKLNSGNNSSQYLEMTNFNNKPLRKEIFKTNIIYRLMYCYNTPSNPYIYNRLKYINLVDGPKNILLKTIPDIGKIWNPNGENAILQLYTKYSYEKLKEKPYPDDKLIFLMQVLNFWENESNLIKTLSLVKDESFKKWFLNETRGFIPTINQMFITNANKGTLGDKLFEFCDKTLSQIRKCSMPNGYDSKVKQ